MLQILKPFYSPSSKVLRDKGYQSLRGTAWSLLLPFFLTPQSHCPIGVCTELGKVSELQRWARDVSKSMVDPDCVSKTTISGLSSVVNGVALCLSLRPSVRLSVCLSVCQYIYFLYKTNMIITAYNMLKISNFYKFWTQEVPNYDQESNS